MEISPSEIDTQVSSLPLHPQDTDSQFSPLVYDLSQKVQTAMENMLKMTTEIDQSATEITEEIEKLKEYALERKKVFDEEKERFQKAAYTILHMLDNIE